MDLCCQSCGKDCRRRKKAYTGGCKNPDPTVDSCAKTPLVPADSYEEGSGRGFQADYQESTMLESVGGADGVTDQEFAGLMNDLDVFYPTDTFAGPSDGDGTMRGSMGGPGSVGEFDGLMDDLDALLPTGTVIGPSNGIREDMKIFDQQIRYGQQGFGDVGTSCNQ